AWYCMNLDEKYYNVLMIVFACVLIHAGFNLLIWILRKVPLIPIHIPVRIVLGLLYLYQFIQVQSWSYRQILIPFFLHRFFIK
ncbi:hypothetical protein JW926_08575, partial [Candidatus Sumerlaeota bacterium]|nr:hypothetical protein [Candidatus Sumerlaeota bacterium]